jgi:hypothetical protein
VFETGNLGDVDHRQFDYVKTFQYPDHLFFYSTKSLEHLLGRTGFELRRLYRYSLVPGAWQAKQLRRLAGLVASARTGSGTAPAAAERATGTAPPRTSRSTLGNVARTALDLSAFGSRLTIGAMRRNPRELQTLVVVARKTGAPA